MAAKSLLEDSDHTAGTPCSNKDCPHPICINSKVAKIKIDTDNKRANKRGSAGRGAAPEGEMNSAVSEDNMELWWQDLQSLGVLELPAAADIYNTAHATLNGRNDPENQHVPASLSCCWGHEMQFVRNDQPQPQPLGLFHWMGEETLRSPAVQNSSACLVETMKTCSRQILPVSQPMATEQTDPSCRFVTAAISSQDSQVMTIAPLMANIPPPPQIRYGANHGELGIKGSEADLLQGPKINTHTTFLSSPQIQFMAGEFESASDISRNPTRRMECSRKLFGILSLILQAFDGPHTAELEGYYASALQKALTEIQHAKRLYE